MAKSKKTVKKGKDYDIIEEDFLDRLDELETPPVKEKKPKKPKKEKPFPENLDEDTVTIEEPEAPKEEEPQEPEPKIEMKPVQIRQATIKKDDIFCSFGWDNYNNNNFIGSSKHSSLLPVHNDLKECFKALNDHLSAICEEQSVREDQFTVTSFKLEGKPIPNAVVLSGIKLLTTNESVKLETPVIKFQGSYFMADELQYAIERCVQEVEAYKNGKQAPMFVQQDMFDKDDEFDINKTIEGKKEELLPNNEWDEEMKLQAEGRAFRKNQTLPVITVLGNNPDDLDEEPVDTDPLKGSPNFSSSDLDTSNDNELF